MTTTPSGSASSSPTWARNSAMTASSSHLPAPTKNWIGLRGSPGLDGDRLGGLALQAAEPAADDQGGRGPLLDAVEPRQVALEEGRQAVGPVPDGVGGDDGVGQEGLGLGMIQERHREPSGRAASPPEEIMVGETRPEVTRNRLQ